MVMNMSSSLHQWHFTMPGWSIVGWIAASRRRCSRDTAQIPLVGITRTATFFLLLTSAPSLTVAKLPRPMTLSVTRKRPPSTLGSLSDLIGGGVAGALLTLSLLAGVLPQNVLPMVAPAACTWMCVCEASRTLR
eukprot:Mycagemm_TRINITY_DN9537_c0_g1::TRINITY_DN9537_c0_g1_i2::g.1581::m.1581 type:complete len:134 gc:universal TRINITY_DN9537_c0_g1_i2:426-25(-)